MYVCMYVCDLQTEIPSIANEITLVIKKCKVILFYSVIQSVSTLPYKNPNMNTPRRGNLIFLSPYPPRYLPHNFINSF